MIQASESTAQLLIAAGKEPWVMERVGGVEAKGKGKLQTYWLSVRGGSGAAPSSSHSMDTITVSEGTDEEEASSTTGAAVLAHTETSDSSNVGLSEGEEVC